MCSLLTYEYRLKGLATSILIILHTLTICLRLIQIQGAASLNQKYKVKKSNIVKFLARQQFRSHFLLVGVLKEICNCKYCSKTLIISHLLYNTMYMCAKFCLNVQRTTEQFTRTVICLESVNLLVLKQNWILRNTNYKIFSALTRMTLKYLTVLIYSTFWLKFCVVLIRSIIYFYEYILVNKGCSLLMYSCM